MCVCDLDGFCSVADCCLTSTSRRSDKHLPHRGFVPLAQIASLAATLGFRSHNNANPNGVAAESVLALTQPLWGRRNIDFASHGSR